MGYNIAEFVAVTSRSLPGVELVANDGTFELAPPGYAAPSANSRIDVIWVRSRFAEFGDASDAPEFGITKGAASPTPAKPSLPAGALELAVAEVKATDTTTQTVIITQSVRYTAMAGGSVPLRNRMEQDAWAPADGSLAHRIDNGIHLVRVGGAWAERVPAAHQGRRGSAAQPAGIEIPTDTVQLPQGVIVKTGTLVAGTTVSFGNEYFPVVVFDTPFPNKCLSVTANPLTGDPITKATGAIGFDTVAANRFRALIPESSNPWVRGFTYIAVGY
ncbi:hypothetical protein [Microbacterium sp. AG238]|uniref:gp53-like domain-containing protein n=1 Tax=Microbacterium sp. AG238 TaxID=2183994 RepID=UPI0011C3CA0D|nr:hypothetical protein [Microbacterium sp. AG238]